MWRGSTLDCGIINCKDFVIDNEHLRVRSATGTEVPIGTEVLVNEGNRSPVLLCVKDNLAPSAERLATSLWTGVPLFPDLFQKGSFLHLLIVTTFVEELP